MAKRALLIGINYLGTSSALNGCINDVLDMKEFLTSRGYSDITLMTDETDIKPTKINIISAITKLLLSNAERLFIHYSGHGSWQRDMNGDESDHRDEAIVPLDCDTAGLIVDDHLRGLLSLMSAKSKLTIVLDSCHSGTGFDLGYLLNLQERVVRVKRKKRVINKNVRQWLMTKTNSSKDTPGDVVLFSGCCDTDYSADTFEDGKARGAMTFCVLKCIKEESPQNWLELLQKTRNLLKSHGYQQVAMLSSGRMLSLKSSLDFC
jgi:hypothetical protein